MITKKISPGKWKVWHEFNVQNEKNRFICSTGRNSSEKNNHEQNLANALAISKVPEMLDILTRVHQEFLNSGCGPNEWMHRYLMEIGSLFESLNKPVK